MSGRWARASAADGVFLTWEWLFTWWKHLGRRRQPILVVVRRGRRLVAVAPLARSFSRWAALLPATLELLGSGRAGSDCLGLLVRGAGTSLAPVRLQERSHPIGARRVSATLIQTLQFLDSFHLGGAERQFLNLFEGLRVPGPRSVEG